MAVSPKIKEYLEKEGVAFEISEHPLAYTASEIAGSQHIAGKQMVKSVIVKNNGDFFMCVLPAIHLVDFEKLKSIAGMDELKLADEDEIAKLFPEYEIGAEPPFGHLYGLKVYADKVLEGDEEIVFNAGTHTDVVKMKFVDFKRLANPTIADIGTHI
ncbi:MAG: Proline--tRNA ligase [Chlamydiae bacterium]|nr:Proline--tRNA ligase [Chlamydiota bacterium]